MSKKTAFYIAWYVCYIQENLFIVGIVHAITRIRQNILVQWTIGASSLEIRRPLAPQHAQVLASCRGI